MHRVFPIYSNLVSEFNKEPLKVPSEVFSTILLGVTSGVSDGIISKHSPEFRIFPGKSAVIHPDATSEIPADISLGIAPEVTIPVGLPSKLPSGVRSGVSLRVPSEMNFRPRSGATLVMSS